MSGRRYYHITPQLLSMISRAAHINYWEGPKIVMETIDAHVVMCIGRIVKRNSLDGQVATVMIRWKIDGKPATRRQVYERFGVIKNVPIHAAKVLSEAGDQAATAQALEALAETVDRVLQEAPCDCGHKRRYEDDEHLSGCWMFDLHAAFPTPLPGTS